MTQPFSNFVDEFVPVYKPPWITQEELDRIDAAENTTNVFCPTGAGGGKDPTCSPGGPSVSSKATKLTKSLAKHGGFTYSPLADHSPTDGYMVSPYKDRERVFDQSKMSTKDLVKYINGNADLLTKKDHYIGGWVDAGKVYVDISVRSQSKDKALKIAHKHKQLAIFDLAKKETIYAEATTNYRQTQGSESGSLQGVGNKDSGTDEDRNGGTDRGRVDRGPQGVLEQGVNVFCPTGEGGGKDPTCSPPSKQIHEFDSGQRHVLKSIKEGTTMMSAIHRAQPGLASARSMYITTVMPANELEREGYIEKTGSVQGHIGIGASYAGPGSAPAKDAEKNDPARSVYQLTAKGRKVFGLPDPPKKEVKEEEHYSREEDYKSSKAYADVMLASAKAEMEKTKGRPVLQKKAREKLTRATKMLRDLENKFPDLGVNVFCPTGKGGGVDSTCSPKGKGASQGGEPRPGDDTSDAHFRGVRYLVNETTKAWKYQEPVTVLNELGRDFEVGGKKWREGGNCNLSTGEIKIFTPGIGSVEAARRITAHELMHGTYAKVKDQYDHERRSIMFDESVIMKAYDINNPVVDLGTRARKLDEMSKTRASGRLKPEYVKEYPTYNRMFDVMEVPLEFYIKDDGITPYSEAYWKDFHDRKVSYDIALHETLAEIAAVHESTGVIKGSKVYKDLYKSTKDEYKIITGQKKRPRPKVTKNEESEYGIFDHVMYLNNDLEPVDVSKATIIKWWKGDMTGYATLVGPTESTVNVYCPTGKGGGKDPTCSTGGSGSSSGSGKGAPSTGMELIEYGTDAEKKAANRLAKIKIKNAPVPSKEEVVKARKALREDIRAGGNQTLKAKDRRKQRENLFKQFGGEEKGYVVCPWTGQKLHHTTDRSINPKGYPQLERGKIFVKYQGGGYQLPNLLPESYEANHSRNAKTIRPENLD